MENTLNYLKVLSFMRAFDADFITAKNELYVDERTNIFISLHDCKTMEDVEYKVIYALCRPIGFGLEKREAKRLLQKINNFYKVKLSRKDMRTLYSKMCFDDTEEAFKSFIARGFHMDEFDEFKEQN